jgi:DNA-binding CsgD family transcriptional regulator
VSRPGDPGPASGLRKPRTPYGGKGRHTRALHPAERKYLLDAARGLTAAQSAQKNCVSFHTVNTVLKKAKAALGAHNITHAVALCLSLGEFTTYDVRKGEHDMILFTESDQQMLKHAVKVVCDRMHDQGGYTEQDELTMKKLNELAKARTSVIVITGDDPAGGGDDPQVREMFRDIVRAELRNPVPDASQMLLYRAGRILGIGQPNPEKGLRDCGPDATDHVLARDWVLDVYLYRCSDCFRLFDV